MGGSLLFSYVRLANLAEQFVRWELANPLAVDPAARMLGLTGAMILMELADFSRGGVARMAVRNVGELAFAVGCPRTQASAQLANLALAGLVEATRLAERPNLADAREHYYELALPGLSLAEQVNYSIDKLDRQMRWSAGLGNRRGLDATSEALLEALEREVLERARAKRTGVGLRPCEN